MSSTTNHNERGQALVIFAGIVAGLLLAGAMAIDVGMIMLERRDQQNAADAGALAGAKELPASSAARAEAGRIALLNCPKAADDSCPWTIRVGVTSTRVVVNISRTVGSYFASLAGIPDWDVGSTAVALSQTDQPPFAALTALNPHACDALKITGSGRIASWGDVQVNSDCVEDALVISGQGNLDLQHDGLACWVVAATGEPGVGYLISGKGQGQYCDPPQPGIPMNFPVDAMPEDERTPTAPLQVAGTTISIPDGCPGTVGYSDTTPKTCQFTGTYKGTTWRIYPGYYPGGLKLQGGTFYLEPGIYHLAGGGFDVSGVDISAISVDEGGTTLGGGILLFNTTHANALEGPININGSRGTFNFHPLGGLEDECSGESEGWNRYLVFQDPAVTDLTDDDTLTINGGSNDMEARGLIFAPTADVIINGGTGTLSIDAIVADTYGIRGNNGTLNVLYDNCALPTYSAYGLVI